MKSVGESARASRGRVPRAGRKGEQLLFQFILRTFYFISLPPGCFLVSYSFLLLLCYRPCSRGSATSFEVVGGMEGAGWRLEGILANRPPVGLWKRASLETRGCTGCSSARCSLPQHPRHSPWPRLIDNGERLRQWREPSSPHLRSTAQLWKAQSPLGQAPDPKGGSSPVPPSPPLPIPGVGDRGRELEH